MLFTNFLYLILLGQLESQQFLNTKNPVCVVGAGISGLSVAHKLKDKGYAVKLFDQSSQVGGKMEAFRKDGVLWNMGPVLITDQYIEIKKIIDKFQIQTIQAIQGDTVVYNQDTGLQVPVPSDVKPEVVSAFMSYYKLRQGLNVNPGHLNANPELFEPCSVWMKKNNLEALSSTALTFLTMEGYGALDETPAIYLVHLLDLLGAGKTNFYQVPNGMDEIAIKYAQGLDVSLNTKVNGIVRNNNQSIIFTKTNDGKLNSQFCNSVILAFPPLLNDLSKIIPDLSKDERDVLQQVSINKYATFANYAPGFTHNAYSPLLPPPNPPILGDGRVVIWYNHTKSAFVSYSWTRGEFKEPANQADMASYEKNVRETFLKLNPGKDAKPALYGKSWTYFPHVRTQSLKDGFYQKFDKIQGAKGLYYSTPLLAIETLERAVNVAQYIVDKYY